MHIFFTQAARKNRGFIALTSALIISVVLIGLVATVSASTFFARFDALGGEYKRIASGLAESCANVALLRLAQDYTYAGGEVVSVGIDSHGTPETCTIGTITKGVENPTTHQSVATIPTSARYPAQDGAHSAAFMFRRACKIGVCSAGRATVVVATHVNNNDGGTKQAGNFAMSMTAGNASPATFAGSESGTIVYVDAGSYSVAGSDDSTYIKTLDTTCSGTAVAGDVKSCTVTYDDIPITGTLTVIANIKNDNAAASCRATSVVS